MAPRKAISALMMAIILAVGLGASARTGEAAERETTALIARIEGPQSPDRKDLDGFTLRQLMDRFHVPGVSVAVIRDFRIDWAKGYGVADVETGRPVEPDTPFQAASISKPVTAMAVLRAAQEGRLSLDDDVNKALKSWKVPEGPSTKERPVTLRALLSHTSGADDGFGFPGYAPSAPRPSLVQILAGEKPSNVGPVRFKRPPLAAYKYSGGGLTIVQLAMTDALARPFAEVMRSSILEPLEMKGSTFEQPIPPALEPKVARAHDDKGRILGARWHVYPEQAAAGLWTTPGDLARFAVELQRTLDGKPGRVLARAAAREMITPVGVGPFAVGLVVEKRGEGWYFNHSGGNWGFRCDLVAHVRKGYGAVVMTNGGDGRLIAEIEARVAAAYGWDSLDKPIPR